MAPITKSLALFGSLLAAFASAAPVDKRDQVVEIETVTSVVWTTVDVTTTVTVEPTATNDAVNKVADHTQAHHSSHHSSHTTSTTAGWEQPVWTAPAVPSFTWTPEVPQWTTSVATSTTEQWHATTTSSTTSTTSTWTTTTTTSSSSTSTSTTAAAAATTSASSSGSGSSSSGVCSESSPCSGDITYYEVGLGSCGETNTDSEHVLALSHTIMQKSYCGKTVTINYGGKTATGTIVDTCMGCTEGSIDLSSSLFLELAELGAGRVSGVDWYIQ
ncbi:RlpA-like double-psi beta-barrel domain-containing protein [Aspergillus fijiensis CBS 313.89]|uniref:RlpA-like protein double-psi beta-barrel domain-containing protein n=1 Tax=Aspergillus fijiensis CBS 313.89 TaxID=1448319 RepID=A0A8G1VUQ9_9EURO|nr:uncharacterized protein BO72DRAFT_452811 [Aspergillus fijiensis CBS 313.89]RAK72391.1 hypothetical protein BO72DRAFT_452811 [Aspergillus fijiensis CBS 313.89]